MLHQYRKHFLKDLTKLLQLQCLFLKFVHPINHLLNLLRIYIGIEVAESQFERLFESWDFYLGLSVAVDGVEGIDCDGAVFGPFTYVFFHLL